MMDDEKKEKYRRLVNNLWSIYSNYDSAINNTNSIRTNMRNGIKLNEEVVEAETVNNAVNSLRSGKSSIYSIISSMRYKT